LTFLPTVGKPSSERRALLHPGRRDPRIGQESHKTPFVLTLLVVFAVLLVSPGAESVPWPGMGRSVCRRGVNDPDATTQVPQYEQRESSGFLTLCCVSERSK